jgi:hypothetical protein
MRFHLRPLGVCQYQTNHRKLESQSSFQWNPESQQTLENWQSEFLQLLWQVGGLAYFLYLGSPQSREGDERKEAKLDALLRHLGPEGERIVTELDERYPRR